MWRWILLAISLALDVFAAGLACGLAGLPRSRWLGVAATFAIIGAALLALGLVLGQLLGGALGNATLWLSGVLLVAIGGRAVQEGLRGDHDGGGLAALGFGPRAILLMGVVIAIDKFAVGLSAAAATVPLWPITAYAAVQGFVATLLGMALGKRLGTRIGSAAELLAGGVFLALGLLLLIQAATGGKF